MASGQNDDGGTIESAWEALEASWSDDQAHRRFIAFCSLHGQLGEAGRRYRRVRDRDPERAEEAARRLEAVLGAALATLDATRTRLPKRRSRLFWAVCGVCLGLLGYGLLTVLRQLAR